MEKYNDATERYEKVLIAATSPYIEKELSTFVDKLKTLGIEFLPPKWVVTGGLSWGSSYNKDENTISIDLVKIAEPIINPSDIMKVLNLTLGGMDDRSLLESLISDELRYRLLDAIKTEKGVSGETVSKALLGEEERILLNKFAKGYHSGGSDAKPEDIAEDIAKEMLSKTRDIFDAVLKPSDVSAFSVFESMGISSSAEVLARNGYNEHKSLLINLLKRPVPDNRELKYYMLGSYANVMMAALYTKYGDSVLKIILSSDPQELSGALSSVTKEDIEDMGPKIDAMGEELMKNKLNYLKRS